MSAAAILCISVPPSELDLAIASLARALGSRRRVRVGGAWRDRRVQGIYTAPDTVIEAERLGLKPITTPASHESNGMAEAFVNTLKRDYVAGGDLASATRVIGQIPGWIEDYNTFAPHSSLDQKSPAEFRREQQTVEDTGCLTK
jgi:hypothetical protein